MEKPDVLQRLGELNIWKKGGERAPHKPLLLLYALGRWQAGHTALSFREVEPDLTRLLQEFGPSRRSDHPEQPFWRLQYDGVWEVDTPRELELKKGDTIPKIGELRSSGVEGRSSTSVQAALTADASLVSQMALQILDEHFPDSLHPDILDAVGLRLGAVASRRRRDTSFRARVLATYGHRCAVCGFDVRLGTVPIAISAAHICWPQAGGPETEENGLALCALHHKLFDAGAFTVAQNQVLVSELAQGSAGLHETLLAFHGQPIRKPGQPAHHPAPEYLSWHRRQVFKEQPRPARLDQLPPGKSPTPGPA